MFLKNIKIKKTPARASTPRLTAHGARSWLRPTTEIGPGLVCIYAKNAGARRGMPGIDHCTSTFGGNTVTNQATPFNCSLPLHNVLKFHSFVISCVRAKFHTKVASEATCVRCISVTLRTLINSFVGSSCPHDFQKAS